MSTGDIKNNLRKLQTEIRLMKYPDPVDVPNLSKGVPAAFLPIYHYAFTQFSVALAEKISAMDIELFGKSDLRFMEAVYKILRDMFNYRPLVTKDQFFSTGFSERKVIMSAEILNMVRLKKKELEPSSKSSSSLRASTSMDSLHKSSGQTRAKPPEARRVSMIESSKGKKILKNSSMTRSSGSATGGTVGLTRPATAPAERPGPMTKRPKPLPKTKEPTLPDRQMYGGTPSIMRVRPSAVEVVRLPRDGEVEDESPAVSASEVNHQKELTAKLTTQLTDLYKMVDEVTSRLTMLEMKEPKITGSPLCNSTMIHADVIPPIDLKADVQNIQHQQETILSRLILLENRMAMMEAKVNEPVVVNSAPPITNFESPASTLKNSNKGAFVSVESVVNGGKLLQKLHNSPEKPVRRMYSSESEVNMNGNGYFNPSPPTSRTATPDLPSQGQATEILPSISSTPTKGDVSGCQYIDESTQNKVERIKNLFNETDGLLKNIGVANTSLTTNPSNGPSAKDLDADVDEKELEHLTDV